MSTLQECIIVEAEEIRKYQEATGKDRQEAAIEWIRDNAEEFRARWTKEHNIIR